QFAVSGGSQFRRTTHAGVMGAGRRGRCGRIDGAAAALERRAQDDLLVVQTGGGQRLIPAVEATARGGDQRDVVLLHALGVEVDALPMQVPQSVRDGVLIPLAVAAYLGVVQPGGGDGAAPGAEMLALGRGGGQLRVYLRADVPPAQVFALL